MTWAFEAVGLTQSISESERVIKCAGTDFQEQG